MKTKWQSGHSACRKRARSRFDGDFSRSTPFDASQCAPHSASRRAREAGVASACASVMCASGLNAKYPGPPSASSGGKTVCTCCPSFSSSGGISCGGRRRGAGERWGCWGGARPGRRRARGAVAGWHFARFCGSHLDVVTADVRVRFEHLGHDGSAGAVQAADEDLLGRRHLSGCQFSSSAVPKVRPLESTATSPTSDPAWAPLDPTSSSPSSRVRPLMAHAGLRAASVRNGTWIYADVTIETPSIRPTPPSTPSAASPGTWTCGRPSSSGGRRRRRCR